jgi:hypothetical protein
MTYSGATNGKVYFAKRSGSSWSIISSLGSSDATQATRNLGISCAIDATATFAVAGAYLDDGTAGDSGAVYVFSRSGDVWSHAVKLKASDITANAYFGYAVSVCGDGSRLVVGAYNMPSGSTGKVYWFSRNDGTGTAWTQEASQAGSETGGSFGYSVSMDYPCTRVAIGVPFYDGGFTNQGIVDVYTRSGTTWSLEQSITQSVGAGNFETFGRSVALSAQNEELLIGATGGNGQVTDSGTAWTYRKTMSPAWTVEQEIFPTNGALTDEYGTSVAMDYDGLRAFISSPLDEVPGFGGSNHGSVTEFSRSGTTWTFVRQRTMTSAASTANLGGSVSVDHAGTWMVAGAASDDTTASNSGSVTFFDIA